MRKGKDTTHHHGEEFSELDDFLKRSKRSGRIEDKKLRKLVKAIHDSENSHFDDFYDDDLDYFKRKHNKSGDY